VRTRHAFLTNVHLFTPNLINELRVGFQPRGCPVFCW